MPSFICFCHEICLNQRFLKSSFVLLFCLGFENLAKHLSMDDVKDDTIFIQLISLGKSSLLEVKPMEIMPSLVQGNVIR